MDRRSGRGYRFDPDEALHLLNSVGSRPSGACAPERHSR
jgi:hypothetical protein